MAVSITSLRVETLPGNSRSITRKHGLFMHSIRHQMGEVGLKVHQKKTAAWTSQQTRSLVAVRTLDAILVLANQAQKVPQNWTLILRIPRNREAHMEILRNQRRDDDA